MSPAHPATAPAPSRTDENIDPRLDFWRSAVDILGADPNQLDRIDIELDPLSIIEFILPASSAEDRSELLWALGEFERRNARHATSQTPSPSGGGMAADSPLNNSYEH